MSKNNADDGPVMKGDNDYENPISLMLGLLLFREKTPTGKLIGCLILIVVIYGVISTGYLVRDLVEPAPEAAKPEKSR